MSSKPRDRERPNRYKRRLDRNGIPILDGFTPFERQVRDQQNGREREPRWNRFAEEESRGRD